MKLQDKEMLEDLIVAKLEWAAAGESERQLREVASLLAVAGDDIDAPAGKIVFVRDPSAQRKAVAKAEGTTILQAVNEGRVRKLAVIVVNARADPANDIYQSPSRPGIAGMIGSVTSVPIDSATSSVSSQMDVLLAQLNAAGAGGAGNRGPRDRH
jgi:hypothetical protein